MKKPLLALVLSLLLMHAHGQEMWGISNSNYAGAVGVALNPSSIVGAPYRYDLNPLSMDIFIENNLAYFPASDRIVYRAFSGSKDGGPTMVIDSTSSSKKSFFMHHEVLGPSFVWNVDNKHSWGFHTAVRTEIGVLKVPYGLNNFGVEITGSPSSPIVNFNVPHFTAAMMSWAELGVTYGQVASNETNKYIKWGATLNYLIPFDGMYADVRKLTYSTTLAKGNIQDVDATIAQATPGNSGSILAKRGWGLGSTIGVTYVKDRLERAYSLKKAAEDLQKYKYRLGLTLMDAGMIRFNSDDASVADFTKTGGTAQVNLNGINFNSLHQLDTTLVNRIGGKVSNVPFNMWLPTALSAQFDYSLSPRWYVNVDLLNRIHFAANQVARGNQDVIALRYERRKFEMAFNLNLFEYSSLSSGFCLRYKWFFIGTDRLSQMLSFRNFNAIDLYFGFKANFIEYTPKTKKSKSCPAYKLK